MKRLVFLLAGGLLILMLCQESIKAQDRGFAPGSTPDDSLLRGQLKEAAEGRSDALKNPELAGALSVLVPGLGQIYNGEQVKGAIIMAAFLGSIGVCVAADIGGTPGSISTLGWIGVGMVGTSYLWGIIDAPVAAHRINKEMLGGTSQSVLEIQVGGYSLSLRAGMTRYGAVACVAIRM